METLPRTLVECNTVRDFWVKAISWWNSQSGNSYTVDVLSILVYLKDSNAASHFVNSLILFALSRTA